MGGRQTEFERVAMPHVESLLRFARRMSRSSRARADDLVQETYLQAWRAFGRLRPDSNVRAWLFTILINTIRGEGRKAQRSVELLPLNLHSAVASRESAEESLGILEALNRLPEDQRTVLILSAVEGFTSREIAEILNVPPGTVMSRVSRARQAMRTALAPETENVG
jgi:RNA polymerase sigma-70 factor (ECF subfamily)